jgi:hypothetical protein
VEIQARLTKDGRTLEWIGVARAGNNAFKEVYDVIWEKTILRQENVDVSRYGALMLVLKELAKGITKQPQTTLADLYAQAAAAKPQFDALMQDLSTRFKDTMGIELVLTICKTLKKSSRVTEKSQLRAGDTGNVSGVKDVVRAMATTRTMGEINSAITALMEMHREGLLEIVRFKDRFLENPSTGGWRDLMVNICVTDSHGVGHICELQIVHQKMLNARKGLAGHVVYNRVRNAMELLQMDRGAVDIVMLSDFAPNLQSCKLANWLTDAPVSTWEGVITSTDDDRVLDIDIFTLDPQLQVRHRLPNLVSINLAGLKRDDKMDVIPGSGFERLPLPYMERMAKDYQYQTLKVDISGHPDVTDEYLAVLVKACVQWKELNLQKCFNITAAGLLVLAEGCPNLLVKTWDGGPSGYGGMQSPTDVAEVITAMTVRLQQDAAAFTGADVLATLEAANGDVDAACKALPIYQAFSTLPSIYRAKWQRTREQEDGEDTEDTLDIGEIAEENKIALTADILKSVCISLQDDASRMTTFYCMLREHECKPSMIDVVQLGKGLQQNQFLTDLYLNHCNIVDITPLAEGLRTNGCLETLDLSDNSCSDIRGLADVLRNNTALKYLTISNNPLVNVDAFGLMLAENKTLQDLDLSNNKIKDVAKLGSGLVTNSALETLNLGDNEIVDINIVFVSLTENADWGHETKLEYLYAEKNNIVNISAAGDFLAKNITLQSLMLSNNKIGEHVAFAEGLKTNTTLIDFDLDKNLISDADITQSGLVEAVEAHPAIQVVNLAGMKLSDATKAMFKKVGKEKDDFEVYF